ncbi:MAG: hypothetical protein WBQ50_03020 [Nocardioides sp.]
MGSSTPGRLATGLAVLLLGLVPVSIAPASAAGDIPTPPRAKLNVYGLHVSGLWNDARGYCTITAKASGFWKRAPKKKGTTNGHYLLVTTEVIAPAGYGGSLTKTLAKKTVRSSTYSVPHTGLPQRFAWQTDFIAQQGSGDYGARITVRVVRAVAAGADTTAWKLVATTGFKSGICPGGFYASP